MKKTNALKNYRFPIILLLSIIIGSIIGLKWGEKATVLKPFGDVFINLMFTIVVPLVFVTIASAVGNMVSMKRLGKILGGLFGVFVATGLVASVIIIIVVTAFPPAQGVNLALTMGDPVEKVSIGEQIVQALTVNDFSELFSKENMLPLIIFAILFGICVANIDDPDKRIASLLDALGDVMMKLVGIVMLYAPIGLGAYFASLIGEFGPKLLGSYLRAMVIYYPVCLLYFVIMFPAYAYISGGKEAVRRMVKNILPPAITAFATGSSIATMPVNLESAKKIGVPQDIREIVMPLGATMHMDGTCLSSILKISFLFGVFGQQFTGAGTFITAILISVLGGVVMSGVPGGGLIGEMLIVNIYGFPPEAFPVIATIGFLVDPPATMINSSGDTIASMLVARVVEGKNWLNSKVMNK